MTSASSPAPRTGAALRRSWELRRLSQRLSQRMAHRLCGRVAIDSTVKVVMRGSHGERPVGSVQGLTTCGQAWECAVCRGTAARERIEQVRGMVALARDASLGSHLLTLTIRRPVAIPCAESLDKVKRAWAVFANRSVWREINARCAVVRALDVTAGLSGWHPHWHVLVVGMGELSPDELERVRQSVARSWSDSVAEVDEAARPELSSVGCDLRESSASRYLAKLGFELSGNGKIGRRQDRFSPWQLLDLLGRGADWAKAAWREYVEAFRRSKLLQTNAVFRELASWLRKPEERESWTAWECPADAWRLLARRWSWVATVLDACERGESAAEIDARLQADGASAAIGAAVAAREHGRTMLDALANALKAK